MRQILFVFIAFLGQCTSALVVPDQLQGLVAIPLVESNPYNPLEKYFEGRKTSSLALGSDQLTQTQTIELTNVGENQYYGWISIGQPFGLQMFT